MKNLMKNVMISYTLIRNNFMTPFYGWGSNCLRATKPLWGDSFLYTAKSPDFPGTHLIDLKKMKGSVDLGATQWF